MGIIMYREDYIHAKVLGPNLHETMTYNIKFIKYFKYVNFIDKNRPPHSMTAKQQYKGNIYFVVFANISIF